MYISAFDLNQDRPDCYKDSCARGVAWNYFGIFCKKPPTSWETKTNLQKYSVFFHNFCVSLEASIQNFTWNHNLYQSARRMCNLGKSAFLLLRPLRTVQVFERSLAIGTTLTKDFGKTKEKTSSKEILIWRKKCTSKAGKHCTAWKDETSVLTEKYFVKLTL